MLAKVSKRVQTSSALVAAVSAYESLSAYAVVFSVCPWTVVSALSCIPLSGVLLSRRLMLSLSHWK